MFFIILVLNKRYIHEREKKGFCKKKKKSSEGASQKLEYHVKVKYYY